MDNEEKIRAAIIMLKRLKRMVGFFMKKEIGELVEKLERGSDNFTAGPAEPLGRAEDAEFRQRTRRLDA